ncbi:MAG: TraR/DksA C4-type zinc finger protein [Bacteroidota bacterium]
MKQYKKKKYSTEELQEFEQLILEKLEKANKELKFTQEALSKRSDSSLDKLLDDASDTLEKENISMLVDRQRRYIVHLENALMRIHNGTYGICTVTGELIDKERLKVVPHSRHSIDAKRAKEEKEK